MIFDVNAWVGTFPFRSLRDNTPEGLLARLDRSGIDAAAVGSIEAAFHRNVQPANERLVEALAPYGDRLFPMATLNPEYVRWEDDLARCHEVLKVRGVRLFPQYHGYEVDGPQAIKAAKACAERGLPVALVHRLEDPRQRHWMDPGNVLDLGRIARLIAAVPQGTYLILNARGFPRSPLWRDARLREAAWYADLALAEVHYVLHRSVSTMRELADLIDEGGARHLVFGSHVPISYPGAALVKLATLGVDRETLEEISYRRALAIFGLGESTSVGRPSSAGPPSSVGQSTSVGQSPSSGA